MDYTKIKTKYINNNNNITIIKTKNYKKKYVVITKVLSIVNYRNNLRNPSEFSYILKRNQL